MGVMEEGRSRKGGKNCVDSANVGKWSQHTFADRWKVDCERKRGIKADASIWGLNNPKEGVAVSEMRKWMGGTGHWGVEVEISSLIWGMLS